MEVTVVCFLVGLIMLALGAYLFKGVSFTSLFVAVVGSLVLAAAAFITAPLDYSTGIPRFGYIPDEGSYKVGVVYVAGENVTVGVELVIPINGNNKVEHLIFYQYKVADFQSLNPRATKLVVSRSPSGLVSMKLE